MDKKLILVLAVTCSLLLIGCANNQQNQGNRTLTQPFIGGDTGLNTHLLEGLPPRVIQDNGQSPFSYGVVLENQGEADVGPGTDNPFVRVKLEGVNPSQWGLNPNETVKQLGTILRGARKNFDGTILPGEVTTVSFEGLNYQPNIRGNTEFVLRSDICYDYSTISTTQICIKDDVLENIQDSTICTLTGQKNPKNSGGPLHISSLIQNPLAKNKIQVAFTIEHVGTGQFYARQKADGSQELCNPSNTNLNKNRLQVIVKPLSDPDLKISCPRFGGNTQGTIKLAQGAPQRISCTIERTGPSQGRIFQDILEVELRYRYGQFIETPIIVQDVSNEPGGDTGTQGAPNNGTSP